MANQTAFYDSKLLAMLLNNEKFYATSEKSARYTKLSPDGIEGELFAKWTELLKDDQTKECCKVMTMVHVAKVATNAIRLAGSNRALT